MTSSAKKISGVENQPSSGPELRIVGTPTTTPPKSEYWETAFAYARQLKREGIDPESDEALEEMMGYCEARGYDYERFVGDVVDAYPRVRQVEDLEEILADAEAEPYECRDYTPGYRRAVTISYHLSRTNDEQTFYFSSSIAKHLGVDEVTMRRYIKRMVDKGLAVCVDESYQPGRKAKIYRFLGNEPAEPAAITQSKADEPKPRITMRAGTREIVSVKLAEVNGGRDERTLAYEDLAKAVRNADLLGKPQFINGGLGDAGEDTAVAVAIKDGDRIYLGIGVSSAAAPRAAHIHPALNHLVSRHFPGDPGLTKIVAKNRDPELVRGKIEEWVAAGDVVVFDVNPEAPR